MHSGNIGHAQNLDTLIRAATFLRDLDDLRIVLIGGGARRDELKELATLLEVDQVRFMGYQPRELLAAVALVRGRPRRRARTRPLGLRRAEPPLRRPRGRPAGDRRRPSPTARRRRSSSRSAAASSSRPGGPSCSRGRSARAHDGELDLDGDGRARPRVRDRRGDRGRRRRALPAAAPRARAEERAVTALRDRVAAAVLVAAAALVVVGRWERDRRASEENAGMRTVVAAVGPLDSPSLRGFRYPRELPVPPLPARRASGTRSSSASTPTAASSRRSTAARASRGSGACATIRRRRATRLDRREVDRLLR